MKLSYIILITILFDSCTASKITLRKGQKAFITQTYPNINFNSPDKSTTYECLVVLEKDTQIVKSTLNEADKFVFIKVNISEFKVIDSAKVDYPEQNSAFVDKIYFPARVYKLKGCNEQINFKYYEKGLSWQVLTFPLKIRPSVNPKDTFPSTVESNVSIGLSLARKCSKNIRKEELDVFNDRYKRLSLSYGGFINLSSTELNKTNIDKADLITSRKVPTISPGIFFSVGVARFNLGYGLGCDYAIGDYAKRWIYQGKLWHGLILAVELK